jgi:excisionase family DNA binding protein
MSEPNLSIICAEPLMTQAEVAKAIGVVPRTIRAWAADGRFPKPLAHGRRWRRWRSADVQKFVEQLDEQRRQGNPVPAA